MVRRQRLLLVDVQHRRQVRPVGQHPAERRLVHDRAPRRVHQQRARLHAAQQRLGDEVTGGGGEAGVQADDVAPGKQGGQVRPCHAGALQLGGFDVAAVHLHAAAEGRQHLHQILRDHAVPHNAHAAFQQAAVLKGLRPASLCQAGGIVRDAAQRGQHIGHRSLGHALGKDAVAADHPHAPPVERIGDISVHRPAGVRQQAQTVGAGHHRPVQTGGIPPGDADVDTADGAAQLLRGELPVGVVPVHPADRFQPPHPLLVKKSGHHTPPGHGDQNLCIGHIAASLLCV